jgi:photosystem II stability/assembly factor-like uncharacterized protein
MKSLVVLTLALCLTQNILFAQWKIVCDGLNDTILDAALYDVCFITQKKGIVVGAYPVIHGSQWVIYLTNDGGTTWNPVHAGFIPGGSIFSINSLFTNDSTGFISDGKNFHKTSDGGKSWYSDSLGSKIGSIQDVFFVNENIGYIIDGRIGFIYKTTNGGKTFTFFKGFYYVISSLFYINDSLGWAVGEQGLIVKNSSQKSWQKMISGTDLPLYKVFFSDSITGWIAGGYKSDDDFKTVLLITEDGGTNWIIINPDFILISDFYFINDLRGFAVGQNKNGQGVLMETKNGGFSWITLYIHSGPLKAIHFKDGVGWAVGDNGLILRTIDSTYTTIIENINTDNSNNILFHNHPNPFSSRTVIGYRLTVNGEIELSVCDLMGRKVTTLVQERQQAGIYEIEWNAEGMKPGIYFYELKARQSRKVMKMILLK